MGNSVTKDKKLVLKEGDGSLFSVEVDGSLKVRKPGVSLSNGLAWTEDNKTMYYIDSIPRKVFAYDFDIKSGDISKYTIFFLF